MPGSRGLVLRGELRTTEMEGLEPGTRGNQGVLGVARILQRDSPGAGRYEGVADQAQTLGVPARYDYVLGVGDNATDSAEVLRQRHAVECQEQLANKIFVKVPT